MLETLPAGADFFFLSVGLEAVSRFPEQNVGAVCLVCSLNKTSM